MKKFGKFVLGSLSLATLAAGGYYIYKKFIANESDDFDDFDDDFDDFDDLDADEENDETEEPREYVQIVLEPEASDMDETEIDPDFSDEDANEDNVDISEDATTDKK